MKSKKKTDVTASPVSATVVESTPPATSTESPKTGWAIVARVTLSNGKQLGLVHQSETDPDTETVNAFHRRAIVEMRGQLPEGVTFDNSAVVVSTNKIE